MVSIPGLGPKRARILFEELEVSTVEGLKSACEQTLWQNYRVWAKNQKILGWHRFVKEEPRKNKVRCRTRIWPSPEEKSIGIQGIQVELAGSARRRKETIGDLIGRVRDSRKSEIRD